MEAVIMKAIEATAIVTEDGKLLVQVETDMPPGEHEVLLVVNEQVSSTRPKVAKSPLKLKVMNWDNWPPDATFRHEELYDDDVGLLLLQNRKSGLNESG
jgi:hypothetical protein